MQHVMIDLETMGTSTDSAILSIGAVKFDPNHTVGPGEQFYQRVDLESCQAAGLRIEARAVMWWLDPERAIARQKLLEEGDGLGLSEVMFGFAQWLLAGTEGSQLTVWSNGANFDIMIVRTAFMRVGYISPDGDRTPWNFRNERCFRTFKNLVKLQARPTAHHALQDAVDQANDVQSVVLRLGITL